MSVLYDLKYRSWSFKYPDRINSIEDCSNILAKRRVGHQLVVVKKLLKLVFTFRQLAPSS